VRTKTNFFLNVLVYFTNFFIDELRPQSIAMLNIHELAHKKVSLSSNVFVFFFSFLLQLSQTGIIKLSHSNYALIKYNIFCSLHNIYVIEI
jgi:hypothetical protein